MCSPLCGGLAQIKPKNMPKASLSLEIMAEEKIIIVSFLA